MIETIRVVDLTPEQVARCRELTYGDEGYMEEDLDYVLVNEQTPKYRYSQAILITESNQIVGWALVQPIWHSPRWRTQIFVDPDHRRRGYGTLLLNEASKLGKPLVYLDRDNKAFFYQYSREHEIELEYV